MPVEICSAFGLFAELAATKLSTTLKYIPRAPPSQRDDGTPSPHVYSIEISSSILPLDLRESDGYMSYLCYFLLSNTATFFLVSSNFFSI